jgi:hypothetical protein
MEGENRKVEALPVAIDVVNIKVTILQDGNRKVAVETNRTTLMGPGGMLPKPVVQELGLTMLQRHILELANKVALELHAQEVRRMVDSGPSIIVPN